MDTSILVDQNTSDVFTALETAVNRDLELLDEGLHISGAFQIASVPNVISTWWTVFDDDCVEIAKEFSTGLMTVERKIDVTKCAASIRYAILKSRDARKSPLIWASYAHFGV
jgi:hypothetical protein